MNRECKLNPTLSQSGQNVFTLWCGMVCPTPEEIRTLMQMAELTGSKAATLTGLKDSRTVRRWIGGDTPIPFSAWAILVEYAGLGKIWKV